MKRQLLASTGRAAARWLAGGVLLAVLVAGGVAVRVWAIGHVHDDRPVDAIVVLGAAQYNGRPSEVFAARLDQAAALYRAGVAAHIVTVGGGQPGDETTEAQAGLDYLRDGGLPATALTAVGTGDDTLVSLRAAAPVLRRAGWSSIVLVTDPWHSARCQAMAADLGLVAHVSPVTTGPATAAGVAPRYIFRETLGLLFYRLTGASSGAGSPVL